MTTANKITIFRIILVPIMLLTIYIPAFAQSFPLFEMTLAQFIFAILFIIGSISDFLDGYIARKYNQITTFGKFLDPIADKMLVITAFLILLQNGMADVWVVAVIILREFLVLGIRLLAVEKRIVIAASIWGKIKTFSTMIVLIFVLFNQFGLKDFADGIGIGKILMWVCAFITIVSGVDYFVKNRKIITESI